jgi:hypothetical protein
MDKPTTPPGGDASRTPWADESASEPSVGATGLFGTLSMPGETQPWEPVLPPAAPTFAPAAPPAQSAWTAPASPPMPLPPAATTAPPVSAKPLAEPVVHKVVVGGGNEENPSELLDRIRMVSAERATSEKPAAPAAPAPAGQGSSGFTELLRTLGSETPVPRKSAPAAAPSVANSGFTSLLQTLNAPTKPVAAQAPPPAMPPPAAVSHSGSGEFAGLQTAPAPPFAPVGASTPAPAAWQPLASEAPQAVPAAAYTPTPPPVPASAPSTGGFTELLRMTGPGSFGSVAPSAPFGEPLSGPPAASNPAMSSSFAPVAPAANQPGEFTRLFGTFSATEASAPPPPAPSAPEPYSGGGAGSFTRMLSIEQHSEPMQPVYREEAAPMRTGMDYGLTPGAPAAQSGNATNYPAANDPAKDIFWQPPADTAPIPESTPAAGVGITKLIQMLDAPARQEAPPMAPPPAPSTSGGPGVWTQTFASLSSTAPPPAAAPPSPPSWQAPMAPAMPAPPPSPSGPSEFTRIMDSSKMREQAMKGGAPAAAPPPPAQPFAPMPPMQIPAFQAPPMPQVPPMPPAQPMGGMKPMPQPGGFVPPPMAGGFAAPHVPTPQLPAVQAPAAGKLQQLVPVLLVVAIVLLVVVLVTVIFLLKK